MMVFSIDDGDLPLDSVIDGGILAGTFNGRKAGLLVRRSGISTFSESHERHFYTTLVHGNIAVYLGKEDVPKTDLVVYAFEYTGFTLEDFRPKGKEFPLVQDVFSQILDAVVHAHSCGFEVRSLDKLSSFLFNQVGSKVTVKVMPFCCRPIICSEAEKKIEKKRANVKSFGRLLSSFFFGRDVDWKDAVKYDYSENLPPIRFVPCFYKRNVELRPFTSEIAHVIKCSMDPPKCESPAVGLVKKPFFWTTDDRLTFKQDSWESIKKFSCTHEVIRKIDSMEGFLENVGQEIWIKLVHVLKVDLCVYHRSDRTHRFQGLGPPTGGYMWKGKFVPYQYTPCDLLRCIRNMKVHGFKTHRYSGLVGAACYQEYDSNSNIEAGFDVLLSVTLPDFLITVYEALVEYREAGIPLDRSMDRYLQYSYIPRPV